MLKSLIWLLLCATLLTACNQSNNNQNSEQMDKRKAKANTPIIETQMLIRKPVETVFQAFIDPDITSNFWFTDSTGSLFEGDSVNWEWEMYNVSIQVDVKKIIPNKLIAFEWGEPSTKVDIKFTELNKSATYVVIKNYGFRLENDELMAAIKDGTSGFTTVLDGLKAYLEHGINLNLIQDKFPPKLIQHGNK